SGVVALLKEKKGGEDFANERALLGTGLESVQKMLETAIGFMSKSVYLIGLNANRILESLAEVMIGYLLLDQAILAAERRVDANETDRAFYDGKIASARFFLQQVLPEIPARLRIVQSSTLDIMEMDDASF